MKTLIIGATTNPDRYAYLVANKLLDKGYQIEMLGVREGEIRGHKIRIQQENLTDIDTVTLYVSPKNQVGYLEYIQKLKPRRVIFNPGTENPEFENILVANNIEPIEACTLVMLSTKTY